MKFTKDQVEKTKKFYEDIISKAWEDDNFKDLLVSNPEAAIAEFFGKEVTFPEGTKFEVSDQTNEDVIYINIPHKPDTSEVELTDEQLELVAGGEDRNLGEAVGYAITYGITYAALATADFVSGLFEGGEESGGGAAE
jgi:hypothetical protein